MPSCTVSYPLRLRLPSLVLLECYTSCRCLIFVIFSKGAACLAEPALELCVVSSCCAALPHHYRISALTSMHFGAPAASKRETSWSSAAAHAGSEWSSWMVCGRQSVSQTTLHSGCSTCLCAKDELTDCLPGFCVMDGIFTGFMSMRWHN